MQSANADWKMRWEHLSPCWTTRKTDLLKAKC
ncbi:DUF4113 domain-containing protein [Serratia rubidaea]|nr:DUF4113 domain-containing protein [Serratia rubidaea]